MKRNMAVLLVLMTIFLFVFLSSSRYGKNIENGVVELILQIDTGVVCSRHIENCVVDITDSSLRNVFIEFGVTTIRAALYNRYKDGLLIDGVDGLATSMWQLVEVRSEQKDRIIEKLTLLSCVKSVCTDSPIRIIPALYESKNGLYYDGSWHLYGAKGIDISRAWEINKGRNDVIVAVCDGGVDYTHPDLDDGSRTRIVQGYDFGDNDGDPMDDLPESKGSYYSHGTHIAGIIGAIPNNGLGINGIMWNCKIMPIKMVSSTVIKSPFGGNILDFSMIAKPSDVANAIDYAVNNGAHVINLSYGFSGMGYPINEIVLRIPLLSSVIANAYKNNVVIVAAMGNEYDEGNPVNYPAAFHKYLIPVGATNYLGNRAAFSSTGNHISISAPGVEILSTIPQEQYIEKSGTSMSAPVVSGIAGLVISHSKDRGLNLTNDDVKHILERTANDILPEGWDEATGYGRVNAYKALKLIDVPNSIVHGFACGNNAGKTSVGKWIYTGDDVIPAGMYLGVERYKMTKRVVFDTPFLEPPVVWMRERESRCYHAGNPNSGEPYAEVSNVTTTGFDLTYYVYYVPYNSAGTSVNAWVPSGMSISGVAYTAIGVKNMLHRVSLSGPTQICDAGGTFSLSNLPAGATVQWSTGNAKVLQIASGQGTARCTVVKGTLSLPGLQRVTATVNYLGASTTLSRTVQVGTPAPSIAGPYEGLHVVNEVRPCQTYTCQVHNTQSGVKRYDWWLYGDDFPTGLSIGNYASFSVSRPGEYTITCKQYQEGCGWSSEARLMVYARGNGCSSWGIKPNPTPGPIDIMLPINAQVEAIRSNSENTNGITLRQVQVFSADGRLVLERRYPTGTANAHIDLSPLRPGTYHLLINGTEHHVVVRE